MRARASNDYSIAFVDRPREPIPTNPFGVRAAGFTTYIVADEGIQEDGKREIRIMDGFSWGYYMIRYPSFFGGQDSVPNSVDVVSPEPTTLLGLFPLAFMLRRSHHASSNHPHRDDPPLHDGRSR